jgi:hypothetical protein
MVQGSLDAATAWTSIEDDRSQSVVSVNDCTVTIARPHISWTYRWKMDLRAGAKGFSVTCNQSPRRVFTSSLCLIRDSDNLVLIYRLLSEE